MTTTRKALEEAVKKFLDEAARKFAEPSRLPNNRVISLQDFRKAYGGRDFAARMSELIWRDMYDLHIKQGVDPVVFFSAIEDVERKIATNGTKAATRFKHGPLIGLWHKHYFTPAHLPTLLGKKKALRRILDALSTGTLAAVLAATHGYTVEMDARGKLTGEWIVFLPQEATNYYLCCGKHDDD